MIEKLSLRNFQSHRSTSVEFKDGLNVIVGDSDKGKSALLRALFWAIQNKPSGTEFISSWAFNTKGNQKEEVSVSVVKDGRELIRSKTKKDNLYIVDGVRLEAVRSGVPDEVDKFFEFTDVNIQKQMDPPFLLSDTAGKVAQVFNKVIKLESIDEALSKVESMKRSERLKLKIANENVEKLDESILEYSYLPELEKLVTEYESMMFSIDAVVGKVNIIDSIVGDIATEDSLLSIGGVIDSLDALMGKRKVCEAEILRVQSRGLDLGRVLSEIDINTHEPSEQRYITRLSMAVLDYDEGQRNIVAIENKIEALSHIVSDLDGIVVDRDAVDAVAGVFSNYTGAVSVYDDVADKRRKLSSIIEAVQGNNYIVDSYPAEISRLEEALPDICPLCGGQLNV